MRRQAFLILLALTPLVCVPARAQQAKLDTTQFIVVGEGLAAGFADFALRDVYQDKSIGAQMARQMKTNFPQPLIEAPGIGDPRHPARGRDAGQALPLVGDLDHVGEFGRSEAAELRPPAATRCCIRSYRADGQADRSGNPARGADVRRRLRPVAGRALPDSSVRARFVCGRNQRRRFSPVQDRAQHR